MCVRLLALELKCGCEGRRERSVLAKEGRFGAKCASHGFGTSDLSRSCQRQRGARARLREAQRPAFARRVRDVALPLPHGTATPTAMVPCSMSCHTDRLLWLPARQQSWRMARAEGMQQERGAQTRPRVASCVVRAPGARRVGAQHGARARTSRGRRVLGHTHQVCKDT